MNNDLKIIKKKFGEKMAHLCRDLFPSILEEEGKLSQFLLDHFEPSHEIYNDIINYELTNSFKNYIFSLTDEGEFNNRDNRTPKELLDEAGYDFYECKTEEDIQRFKKYYAKGERLCTFNGGRLNSCHVFFAVKKNVDEIKRENFKHPERQDEYGTSVISIQFTKTDNYLSIKNRYNHTVENPDATYSNNLDNIIPGLTYSFERFYGIVQNVKQGRFEIPNYVKALDNKYYKYNCERNNVYYGINNVVITNYEAKYYEKEKYIVFDTYILDIQNKKLLCDRDLHDDFETGFIDIKDIKIEKISFGRKITVIPKHGEEIEIKLDKENNIISYKNYNLINIKDRFLFSNKKISSIEIPNVKTIGNDFLLSNQELKILNLPNVETIGLNFLAFNLNLQTIDLSSVKEIGNYFMYHNRDLQQLSVPKLEKIEDYFLDNNVNLKELYCPNVKIIKDRFLACNKELKEIHLPNTISIGDHFLLHNRDLIKVDLPNVLDIGDKCFYYNTKLEELLLPKVEKIGTNFLNINKVLSKLVCPNLISIGHNSLVSNYELEEINLPMVKSIGNFFLDRNRILKKAILPNLKIVPIQFLNNNECLEELILESATLIQRWALKNNNSLEKLYLPRVREIHDGFMFDNNSLKILSAPSLTNFSRNCLQNNQTLEEVHLPSLKNFGYMTLSSHPTIKLSQIIKNNQGSEVKRVLK